MLIHRLTTAEAAYELRHDDYANWSRAGAEALVLYLESLVDDETPFEFDPVALRCDWAEYKSALEAATEYGYVQNTDDDVNDEIQEQMALEWLEEQTTVLTFTGGVIVETF